MFCISEWEYWLCLPVTRLIKVLLHSWTCRSSGGLKRYFLELKVMNTSDIIRQQIFKFAVKWACEGSGSGSGSGSFFKKFACCTHEFHADNLMVGRSFGALIRDLPNRSLGGHWNLKQQQVGDRDRKCLAVCSVDMKWLNHIHMRNLVDLGP